MVVTRVQLPSPTLTVSLRQPMGTDTIRDMEQDDNYLSYLMNRTDPDAPELYSTVPFPGGPPPISGPQRTAVTGPQPEAEDDPIPEDPAMYRIRTQYLDAMNAIARNYDRAQRMLHADSCAFDNLEAHRRRP